MVSHNGAIQGYTSSLFLLPDVKLGIFVSTTGTISAADFLDMSPLIAGFAADLVLDQQASFDIAASCAYDPLAAIPSPFKGKNIDFQCQDSKFKRFADTFLHPFLDPIILEFIEERQQLSFSFATFGQGLLCNTNFEREKENTLRMFFTDPTMVQMGLNNPRISLTENATMTFRLDSNGKADMIKVHVLGSEYSQDFYRKDVYSTFSKSGRVSKLSSNLLVLLIIYLFLP